MNRSFSSLVSFAVVAAASVTLACSSKSNAPASSEVETQDSVDSSGSASQSSSMDYMVASPVTSADPNAAAASLAAAQWWPANCATRTKDATNPAVVHISLKDCTGPFGLVHWTGDITVTFSKNADGSLHAQGACSNMSVNGQAVTCSRSADITISGTTRTVKATGEWTRQNDRGDTVSHTSNVTVVIDTTAHCRTTNGTATTMVGSREVDSTFQDYKICRDASGADGCPSGTVTHDHKASGKNVTITFDGSAQASISVNGGGAFKEPLVCGG